MKYDWDGFLALQRLRQNDVRILQCEIAVRYSRGLHVIIEATNGVVSNGVKEGGRVPGLMAAGAGQAENEIVVVASPSSFDYTEPVLAILRGIVQSAKELILRRVEFDAAL